ncbi:MAG: carboxypeptidase-like regulatory domain-containing protein [Bacteroidota bacterium]
MKYYYLRMSVHSRLFTNLLFSPLLLGIFLFSGFALYGQTTINGVVMDENTEQPLVGATVLILGQQAGGLTDGAGKFIIKSPISPPFEILITYFGFDSLQYRVESTQKQLKFRMVESAFSTDEVIITSSALSEKQREQPLTVESLSINAIKETPAVSFYDALGSLKGVDLTSASMGFKIINTRGFNSTRPVRSLQVIDAIDNQAPGLNFSVGNFAGSSELDVESVEVIAGASTALYGPGAFNGVISMKTKDPFLHPGLSAMVKVGERNLREGAIRYASSFTNKNGRKFLGYKLNVSYFEADDWEADNFDPTDQAIEDFAEEGIGFQDILINPGGYDAINRYGDEQRNNFGGSAGRLNFPGLGQFYRTGYNEVDLVDYDTENLKVAGSIHWLPTKNIEATYRFNWGQGTTVFQGDNRYSLNNLSLQQHIVDVKGEGEKSKWSVQAYHTVEDAGDSYDAVFTALLLQDEAKPNDLAQWTQNYGNYWSQNITNQVRGLPGYPDPRDPAIQPLWFNPETQDSIFALVNQVLADNNEQLQTWHDEARAFADGPGVGTTLFQERFEPGTARFDELFNEIISRKTFTEGGSGFISSSSLTHIQGKYQFETSVFDDISIGANARLYTPYSEGTIFSDTAGGERITNFEYGLFTRLEKRVMNDRLIFTGTARLDKNENFDYLFSPALTGVFLLDQNNTFRLSFGSAIRNPTLQDQFLFYNLGTAILIGNLNGVDSLINIDSYRDYLDSPDLDRDILQYFNTDAVRPEQVRSIEGGYKGTLFDNKVFIDASYYFSWYRDFLGFRLGVDADFDPRFPFPINQQVFRVSANSEDQVSTQGFSVGLNYYFAKDFLVGGNYSWNVLDRRGSDDEIIPAFNTPEHKFNLVLSGRDFNIGNLRHLGFNINYKWVEGFLFEGSPQFTGRIPTYDMLDVQANIRVPSLYSTFKIGASNVLNNLVFQTYGGPRIGRMGYFSVVFDMDKL